MARGHGENEDTINILGSWEQGLIKQKFQYEIAFEEIILL